MRISHLVPVLLLSVFLPGCKPPPPTNLVSTGDRVQDALNEKKELITGKLDELGIAPDEVNILITAYKAEKQLVIYAKKKTESRYRKLETFDICASSGAPGPKRRQGDKQVPEGFYHIREFNPKSNFYLSLGINYPNGSDKKKSDSTAPGSDIFIHGACVTIGCIPLTDDKIKEVYLYALQAKNNGQQQIPVYIFPFVMSDRNFSEYKTRYNGIPGLINFWKNLKPGFDKFEKEEKELHFSVDDRGNYVF